jgi:adenylylsulfate kinase
MKQPKSSHLHWHHTTITRDAREQRNGHKGVVLWFTGLSGSGKSTLANSVESMLFEQGHNSFVLDGDNVRHGLNSDLGFSPEDRTENIRRIGEVAKLLASAGMIVNTAFISPYRADRDRVREICQHGEFIEIFVDCPLSVCEERDPKGLYKKARAGQIPDFTGISAPYEAPASPELDIRTAEGTVEECAEQVVNYLVDTGVIHPR